MHKKWFLIAVGVSFLYCSDASLSGEKNVALYCQAQQDWMVSCAIDQETFQTDSCEVGILNAVEHCQEDIFEQYGMAYADFYNCLQNNNYCPTEEENTQMQDCLMSFQADVDALNIDELCREASFDGGELGGSNSAFTYEEPPTDGAEIILQNDAMETILLDEPFGGSQSITISSNGLVFLGAESFDDCCFGQELPFAVDSEMVAVAWGDLNPEIGGSIRWSIQDHPSGRALEVVYDDIPLCCGDEPNVSAWTRIWEQDRSVEIHIGQLSSAYPITLGVQYEEGESILPEHNAQSVSIEQKAWLYSPSEGSAQ